ncbi:TetM/TetW/TetO/TetS family tetracycline resistance ribosomal protection protein [Lysinibacillus sphaericus]|uniref:Elongation factor G n=1 Tax=Lysinibacillus sphaericus TaxID=1421 RepID=A0A2S0K0E9_LYSSH|nr:TetM/TetW/TetO/TetS family tetracycline resistance ribosomal protection protein [Lysinibacillus sphaericus]AVK96788.1 elongation factor G [Lysinibacillus sphaericus]MED4545751.1 TetM/TetW/TetO/TetS family tetracycline resistance ribosomal protection protein [Lysinibacillus sphaericus]TKI16690.1 TetM/TetW/TetO/TetS family tetracycline resistance ribosomal protection protein [Lysinibacillus sphaericus]SUV17392.1 translation elongation factor G [Lysinibacillus sphaericus]GEC83858.1 tetracyclin
MYKTIGVLAHVDAGKTTFCEQLLFHTNSIQSRGRVDHQDTFLDNHAIEQARGITIFAEQGRMQIENDTYTLIDTPGHVDFSPEMERAIRVMDYAIIIVSAVEGVQGHTETVWQLLRQYHIPTFFFINKIDREGADINAVMNQLQKDCSDNILLIDAPLRKDFIQSYIAEWLAERDEQLLEAFLTDTLDASTCLSQLQKMINEERAFPCFVGAALKDIGIKEFVSQLPLLTETHFDHEAPFQGEVFKIRHDGTQRLTFIKALQGTLHTRDDFAFGDVTEKITEIRLYNGRRFQTAQAVQAGDIFAVKGLSMAKIGDILGSTLLPKPYELVPTLQAKVLYEGQQHIKEILQIFRLLEAEEPSLRVVWQEKFQEIHVHIMGVIQLEVLAEVLKNRFSLVITFDKPQILYMETIATTVTGYGHFEPLKHYAEVHLFMEPNIRGTGNTFVNACHADDLSVGHQRLIEKHLFEREHHGLLTGSPVTDIRFTLLTGRAHIKHTEGGDFREATFRALRQGLEQAENILLEPYYRFKMKASNDFIGRMMNDIQQADGTFDSPILSEEQVILTGRVPVATFMHYSTTFATYTNGKGSLSLQFDGYDICHNSEAIIAQINYNKQTDPDYTSSSIFCAKGKGYAVPWYEAKAAMHCL